MKIFSILAVCFAAVLSSCASLTPLSDTLLAAKAASYLDGESQVKPLQLTIDTDYVNERWTLVRAQASENKQSVYLPNSPLGLYFGNGLYLDSEGNLVIRLERAAGVGPTWQGKTHYSYLATNEDTTWVKTVNYSATGIQYSNPSTLFDKSYTISSMDKKVDVTLTTFNRFTVYFENQNKIKVAPQGLFVHLSDETYENVSNGVKLSYWKSFFLIPTPASDTFTLNDGKIVDSDKRILVENNGTYLRFAFTKGNEYSFRIFRTPTTFLVLDESTGNPVFLAKKTDDGWIWKAHPVNGLGFVSDKLVTCGITLKPAKS